MSADNQKIPKKYYSISEVAEMFQVNPSLIRFWETEFETLKPNKNKKGERRFTKKDIEDLKLIYHLVKEKGFTLDGAKEHIKTEAHALKNKMKILNDLQQLKATLEALRDQLED